MNAISDAIGAVISGFTTQNVGRDYNNFQAKSVSKTEDSTDPNSFFSILKLFDANADQKIDTNELKFGAGFMINSLIYGRDGDGDQLLSAEEGGVPSGVIAQVDTDGDQKVSAKEMITPADKIIDGLVSILDTDGDSALSQNELAIFELLFNGISSAVGDQGSNSMSVEQELDMNTIPDRMRQAGFQGTDNQLYYVLASTYADVPWQPDPANQDSVVLSDQRDEIYKWFDKQVMDVAHKMEANPGLTATAIINDGPDRLGARLGPAIMDKLKKFGDRVEMGTLYS